MKGKITKKSVDGLGVSRGTSETILWDSEIKGFGIRTRSGRSKTYILHYRAGKGRAAPLRKITIGKHGSPWTPETARTEAKRLLGVVADGRDSCRDRRADKRTITLTELCDLYLKEGTSHKKASTIRNDRSRIEHHIKPLIGRKRVDALTRGEIERLLVDVKEGKTAAQKRSNEKKRPAGSLPTGGTGVAGQCVTLLSTLLSFGVKRGLRDDNPAYWIKKPPTRKIERFLSEHEITRLAAALENEAQSSGNPFPTAAIKLLLLTGCRRSEILNLFWEHVDFEKQCLRLPDSKTGAKVVYLNAPALELLQGLPRIVGNSYVIAGSKDASPLSGMDKIWYRVRKVAKLSGVRLHDLRHNSEFRIIPSAAVVSV
jgi:integrase